MLTGIYAITDHFQTSDTVIERKFKSALEGGVRTFVLRDDTKDDEAISEMVVRLAPLCKEYDASLLLFGRPELAVRLEQVDGVQIDTPCDDPAKLRERMGKKLLGFTCGDLEYAKRCEAAGADYVVLGSFYYSFTDPERPVVPHEMIDEAKRSLSIPIVALGGITVDNAPSIAKFKPDMLGVISGLWLTSNPGTTAEKMLQSLRGERGIIQRI